MLELAKANRAGITVATNADGDQFVIGHERACGDAGHATVQGVETMRAVHEIRRRLR